MDRRTFLTLAACAPAACKRKRVVTVGSKNDTEQAVLGEIIAQQVERRLHTTVHRQLDLGGTQLTHQALLDRQIDIYVEYSGIALMEILHDPIGTEPSVVLARVRQEYSRVMALEWMDPLGFDNPPLLAVRSRDANEHHLKTIGDASQVKGYWVLGASHEFLNRMDAYTSLMRGYPFEWAKAPYSIEEKVLYKSIAENQVNMIAARSTDGALPKSGLAALPDDKHVFPPYQACIVVRADALHFFAGLREALAELSGKISREKMQQLNERVDVDGRRVAEVAAAFLNAGLK